MIYNYKKYKDISSFINNDSKTQVDEDYTILFKCNGFDYNKMNFTEKCFGCLFCIFKELKVKNKFEKYWGNNFIKEIADKSFKGEPIILPCAKQIIKNPIKNLEDFTNIDETTNIQPWAAGLINHMCTKNNRISMEVPVYNINYDRNGRLDICSATNSDLLVMESKVSLDEALKDERFVEQQNKYTVEIEKSTQNYIYVTLFGGKETDLFPTNSLYCTGKIGKKTERFYSIIIDNNIKFISANALWCLCCKYITYGNEYSWDIFIKNIFLDSNCIGLLSAGKVFWKENKIFIIPI